MARQSQTGLTLDHGQLAAMLTTRDMTAAMHARAQAGMDWMIAEAKARAFDDGVYAGSFELRDVKVKVNGVNRSATVLVNNDPKAWAVEWGNGAHHIMQQGVDIMQKMR